MASVCTGSEIDLADVLKNRSCLIDHAAIGEGSVLAEGDTRDATTEGYTELRLLTSVDEVGVHACLPARTKESYSRVILPPGGIARITLPWSASRAHATHVHRGGIETCDVVAQTPLHVGVYTLAVATPLMVSTGRGVELDRHQTRVQVKD